MFNKKKIMKRAVLLGLVDGLFLAMTSYAAPKYVETDIVENKIKAALFSVSLDPGDGTINNSKDPYRIVSNDTNSKVSFPTASKDYYDFKGYALLGNSKATYDIPASGQLTGSVQEYNLPIKDDKGNSLNGTTLKAIFEPHKYEIGYDLAKGKWESEEKTGKSTYTYIDKDYPIPQPTRDGYTFTGWTGEGVTTNGTSSTIKTHSSGNISLTATWRANHTVHEWGVIDSWTFPYGGNIGWETNGSQIWQVCKVCGAKGNYHNISLIRNIGSLSISSTTPEIGGTDWGATASCAISSGTTIFTSFDYSCSSGGTGIFNVDYYPDNNSEIWINTTAGRSGHVNWVCTSGGTRQLRLFNNWGPTKQVTMSNIKIYKVTS